MKEPIVILGSGRCGSTLLQRVLNTSCDITIWGEHAGFLKGIAQAYHTLTEEDLIKQNLYTRRTDPSVLIGALQDFTISPNWVNSFDIAHVTKCFREMIVRLLNRGVDVEETRWGFKEILYNESDHMMEMWTRLFPSTSYLFVVRHPFDVIQSMILAWSLPEDQALGNRRIAELITNYAKRWTAAKRGICSWTSEHGYDSLTIKYEDLVENPAHWVDRIFNWLDMVVPHAALEPFAIKVEESTSHDAARSVRAAIDSMKDDIWAIVGTTARSFGYERAIE